MIRFIKLINDKETVNKIEMDPSVIQDCFVFCIPSVKCKVKEFLETERRSLTLYFGDEIVILRKEKIL